MSIEHICHHQQININHNSQVNKNVTFCVGLLQFVADNIFVFLSWTKSENEVISQLQVPYIHHSDSFQFQHMKLLRECQIWSHFILQQSFWNLWSSIAAALRFPYIRTSSSKYTVDANSETAYINIFLSRIRIPLGDFVLFHIVSYY